MFGFQFAAVLPEGQVLPKGQAGVPVWATSIDDRYFDTMDIPLLAGRAFESTDDSDSTPVAIVNDTLARHYWLDKDPLGKRVRLTEAGQVLYEYARRTLALLDEASLVMEQMRGIERGTLRVGASTTVGIYVVPLALWFPLSPP